MATFAQKSFQLGLQLSPNISWINPDSDGLESEGSKVGFSYGLIGDFNISENYAFSTGITLLSSGGKISYPDREEVGVPAAKVDGRTTADVRLKYIQIPLTLKLKTNEIGYMRYYGQFGFGAAFNYDSFADKEFKYSGGGTDSENKADYGSEINLFRASLIVGLGAEYNLSGNTSLIFGLSFDNGFLNILNKDIYQADDNGNANNTERSEKFIAINNSLVFNFGVLF
jgi:hypothetical protein